MTDDFALGPVKEAVRGYWSATAGSYDDGAGHAARTPEQHQAWLDLLTRLVGPPPLDVLDVGCGTGFLALALAEVGHRVVGVDAADGMLAQARRKAAERGLVVDLRGGDAEAPPVPAGSFDAVVERHVLWTLPAPVAALRAWAAALRPGGRLVLVEGDWRKTALASENEFRRVYEGIAPELPLFGGRPAAETVAYVREAGLPEPVVEPLMDAALWGGPPDRERFALVVVQP